MLTTETLQAYRASRDPRTNGSVLCHAPFVSLNFEQSGRVTACCYNRRFVLGTYPQQTVREIWSGADAKALRKAFLEDTEARGCDLCFHQLASRNFSGTLMRNFDRYSQDGGYRPEVDVASPRVLEFEISNTCNLECIMCGGHWSSAIRARREQLPPLQSPYDRAFVEQIEEYLPSIAAARFLGGEPFLIKRYYEIWESLRRSNPNAEVSITTNATVVWERSRELLEDLRASITVSLDGISAAAYEAIRKNARFDQVMANVQYFIEYTRRRGTTLTVAVCPMTHNWRELPALLDFCEERQLDIYFNTVLRPADASLGGLPASELAGVIEFLRSRAPKGQAASRRNGQQWEGLLSQLEEWHEEKRHFDQRCHDLAEAARGYAAGQHAARRGFTIPQGFDRLVAPLAMSYQVGHERATTAYRDFLTLLPRGPIGAWEEGEPPSARELLLSAHLLCRCLDQRNGDAVALTAGALQDEQRRLGQYHDWLSTQSAAGTEPLQELGRWMNERIQLGEGEAVVEWVRTLVGSFDGGFGQALDLGDELRWRLDGGVELLRKGGLDETACARVAEYFWCLFTDQLRELGLRRQGDGPAQMKGSSPVGLPIRDLDDLNRAMDAMVLYYRYSEPSADHEKFRRRLDSCLDVLTSSGRVAAACRSMEGPAFVRAYLFLAHATEEELARRAFA